MTTTNLDLDQLRLITKPELQAKIVELGADYHVSETKQDLMVRYLQLSGTAQPAETLKKTLNEAGIGAEDGAKRLPVKMVLPRITEADIRQHLKKYIDKGLKIRLTDNGDSWEMRYTTTQKTADNKSVLAKRVDSGTTMMSMDVLKRCAEIITTERVRPANSDEQIPDEEFIGIVQ
jgi:hypothetical protein